MSLAVELSDEVAARLAAEAARRGASVSEVAADVLGAHLPATVAHRLRFVGIAASGRTQRIDLPRERAELARRKYAEGA